MPSDQFNGKSSGDDHLTFELHRWTAGVLASVLAALLLALIFTGFQMNKQLSQIQSTLGRTTDRVKTLETEMDMRVTQRELTQAVENTRALNEQQYQTIISRLDRIENRYENR